MRPIWIEASRSIDRLDLSGPDEWRVLVTVHGKPVAYFPLPSLGAVGDSKPLAEETVARHAEWEVARQKFIDRFRQRLGLEPVAETGTRPTCSVVVCTHRRSRCLPDLLEGLRSLDPPADEVIVVDNDAGDEDSIGAVQAAGARYVREDRRGLDIARTSGLRAATGEIVAFTDGDCVPAKTWLRNLGDLFSDGSVAAVTGPAFALSLDTPAKVRFEESGGFSRGLHRRTFDWTNLAPVRASQTGAGANMLFRRKVLESLGDVFPVELDAGTVTESGGDMFALYKVLAAGHRVVYDPGTFVFHQHPPSYRELHRALRGYGVGFSATLTKLLVDEGEVAALRGWGWLVSQYLEMLARRVAQRAGPVEGRIAWDYLRGGFSGPLAWREARRRSDAAAGRPAQPKATDALAEPSRARPSSVHHGSRPIASSPSLWSSGAVRSGSPGCELSIIVPTIGRPRALSRCLAALARERHEGQTEVLIVDDAPGGASALSVELPPGVRVRKLRTGGRGAAIARNVGAGQARGELLLFLDDDLVPQPGLLRRHIQRHQSRSNRVVIGYSPPHPTTDTLAALAASLWWEDHFRAKEHAAALTFVHVLTGNMSVRRETFERLGGYNTALGRFRREDWEWGLRALDAGIEVVYEPRAVAHHEFSLDLRGAFSVARAEGSGDALLVRRNPSVASSLPPLRTRRQKLRHPLGAVAISAFKRPPAREAAIALLGPLEAARTRELWLQLFNAARRGAYEQGLAEASGERRGRARTPTLSVELNADTPITAPKAVPPTVRLALNGRKIAELNPEGVWDGSLAEQAAAAIPGTEWERLRDWPKSRVLVASPPASATPRAAVLRSTGRDVDRLALERAGARVVDRKGHRWSWRAVDSAIAHAQEDVILLLLPGASADDRWLGAALIALEAERVAVAVGGELDPGAPKSPLTLYSRRLLRARYGLPGGPIQWVGIRREAYEAVGGINAATARFALRAPVLDLIERALDARFVVARRDTGDLSLGESRWLTGLGRFRGNIDGERARTALLLRREGQGRVLLGAARAASEAVLPLVSATYVALRRREAPSLTLAARWLGFLDGCRTAAKPWRHP